MVTTGAKLQELVLYLGSCPKCKGDLVKDDDEWRCLQCGRYYFPQAAEVAVIGRPANAGSAYAASATQKKPVAARAGFDAAFDQIMNTW